MTDKDKMQFEEWYADNAFNYEESPIGSRDCGLQRKSWQAAKESSRKELEAEMEAHAATIQREAKLSLELEAAKQRIAALEGVAKTAQDCQRIVERINHEVIAEKEALEKKIAARQSVEMMWINQLRRVVGDHNAPNDCYSTGPLTGTYMDTSCPSCEAETMLNNYGEIATEELTKLLAAARKEGFEEGKKHAYSMLNCSRAYETGKQAGRDAVMKELSEQEPVVIAECKEVHGSVCQFLNRTRHGMDTLKNGDILVIRPLPPTVKEK